MFVIRIPSHVISCYLVLAILVFCSGIRAADDVRFYGDKNGYDEQLLKNHLGLSERRLLLDLSGEWTVTIDGVKRTINVPSNYDYEGQVVYTKTFTPGPEFRNKHFRLVTYGINFHAEIRINGDFISRSNSAYLHTEIDLDETVIKAEEPNTIEILVDSRLDPRTGIPRYARMLQPKLYGGIFREIFLIALPKMAIDKYHVNYDITADQRNCSVTLNMQLRNYDFGYQKKDTSRTAGLVDKNSIVRYFVELFNEEDPEPVYTNRYKRYRNVWEIPKIREFNEENVVTVNNFINFETKFSIEKPIFWAPVNPYRYRLVISIMVGNEIVDQITEMIGIARSEVHEQYVLFNAQPLTIKGVVYYEDFPGTGNSIPYAVMEQDILKIKKMGANTIYFRHHPPHPYFVELCNRYGLFLMYEAPLHGLTADIIQQQAYVEDLKTYVRSMINYNRMNPCILAWGIGSASDHSQKASLNYFSTLTQYMKTLDDRPIFYTSVLGSQDTYLDNVDMINLDIRSNSPVLINSYINKSLSRWPNRAVVCLYGAQIFSNNQNGYSDPMSTKFQAKLIVDMYKKLDEWKVAGGLIRSYNDYTVNRSYVHANPHYDPTVFTSGLVTSDRKDRFAYDIAKAVYSDDKFEAIPIGTYATVYPKTYPLMGLFLVVVFISFYRQSGKFKNSVFRSITKILSFYSDIRESRVITLWPAFVIGFLGSLALATHLSILFYELRRHQIFDEVMANWIVSDTLKRWIDGLAWSPEAFVFQFWFIFLVVFFLISVMIKLFSFVFNRPLSFQQSLIAGFWSSSHYLFLIPCVILFQRLMKVDLFLFLSIWIALGVFLWHLVRLMRIIKIVFDVSWVKAALVYGGLWLILIFTSAYSYSKNYDFFNVMQFVREIHDTKNYSYE